MVRKFTLRRRTFNKTRYKKKNQLNRYRRSCRGGGNYLPAWLRRIFGLSDTKKTSPNRSEQSQNTGRIQRWFNDFKRWFFQKFDRNPKKEDVKDFLHENGTSFGQIPPVHDDTSRVEIKGSEQQKIANKNVLFASPNIKLYELSDIFKMRKAVILEHFIIDHFRYVLYKSILDNINEQTNFGRKRNINMFEQDLTCVLEDLSFQEGDSEIDKTNTFYVYYCEEDKNHELNDALKKNGVQFEPNTFVAIPTLKSPDRKIKVLYEANMNQFFSDMFRVVMVDKRTKEQYKIMQNEHFGYDAEEIETDKRITWQQFLPSALRAKLKNNDRFGESFEVKGQPVDAREEVNELVPYEWGIAEDKGQPAWATSVAEK